MPGYNCCEPAHPVVYVLQLAQSWESSFAVVG